MRFVLPALAVVAVSFGGVHADEKDFFFKPNDRIVFLGDSITAQYQYSTYMELYLTTRFPEGKFTFLNAGIGGDTAHGGLARFQKQVLDEKPTALTINFGMNDGGYGKFDEGRNKLYRESTEKMLKLAKDANVRVALCSPNAVDPRVKQNGKEYFETQKQFYAPLKQIAANNGASFADQYGLTRAEIEKMTKDDPTAKTAKPYYDGFHTSEPGALIMAHAILTELKAPALVSSVEFGTKGDAKTQKCTVTDLKASETGATFTRLDESLAMPLLAKWTPMLPYINNLKDLNDYGLKISGLAEGKYDVLADSKTVASYTAKELADGVNLALASNGPVYEQGMKVFELIQAKNTQVSGRFFGVHLFNPPAWLKVSDLEAQKKPELERTMKVVDERQKGVDKAVKPVAHKWEVKIAK
jgi:lysophospholipase L1-like esterase